MILLEEAINDVYAKHAIYVRSKNITVQGPTLFQSVFISLIIRGKSIVRTGMTTPCVITTDKAEDKTDHKTAHPGHFDRV